ncbi:PD-(D/E)XK nuclease-like domain-containing protein (plasmid) [Shewanella sp. HL-SH4]|uniref:PD-(D/E)XK nuclease-like domain-containing protein n=1 Tax=Shewanella sp. HL-SH4 TaxID=3436240 RepID=UPI003EBE310B
MTVISLKQSNTHWIDAIQEAYSPNGTPNFMDSAGALIEGIYLNLPNEVYHSLPAESSTKIKTLAKGRHHYFRQYLSDVCRLRTKAQEYTFDAGTYGHMLVLEEHNFHGHYMRNPQPEDFAMPNLIHTIPELKEVLAKHNLPVSGAKAVLIERLWEHDDTLPIFEKLRENAIERFLTSLYPNATFNNEKNILDYAKSYYINIENDFDVVLKHVQTLNPNMLLLEDLIKQHVIDHVVWDDAHRVQKSTRAHPKANWLFSDGFAEISIIAKCPTTGLMLKVRFDWLREDAIAVDLKTTASSNPTKFGYQLRDLRYDIQQVFYVYVANLIGIPVRHFVFVATEYKDADNCETFELAERKRAEADEEMHQLLAELQECFDTEDWYGFDRSRSTWVLDV